MLVNLPAQQLVNNVYRGQKMNRDGPGRHPECPGGGCGDDKEKNQTNDSSVSGAEDGNGHLDSVKSSPPTPNMQCVVPLK